MTGKPPRKTRSGDRRTTLLAVLLVIQSLAAIFFVGDALFDMGLSGFDAHIAFEAMVALALVLGVTFGALEMRRTLEEIRRQEIALAAASGALSDVIGDYFREWQLTPAEAEVALLALKGFDIAEIARFRNAAAGTVRAQLSRVYEKAGVSGRPGLLAVFVEDLLGGGVSADAGRSG